MFDYCGSFLVVKSDDPMAVATALGMVGVTDYREASLARHPPPRVGPTWISRPIRGFVLVSGAVPHCALDLSAKDPALDDVRRLSREFGEAFVFGEDNGCPYCHYAWCRDGEVVRAYAMSTDPECVVLWNVGEATEAERAFSVPLEYVDKQHEGLIVPQSDYSRWLPFEQTAFTLAQAWCVSPDQLTGREELDCRALGGKLKPSWPMPWPTPIFGDGSSESPEDDDYGYGDDGEMPEGQAATYTFEMTGSGLGSVRLPVPDGPHAQERAQQILGILEMMGVSEEQRKHFATMLESGSNKPDETKDSSD